MPTTEQVIAEMLTENTGRNLLDSGDAYGRHWQRNAGMTPETFAERPTASWGWHGEYVVLDTFHWLIDRLQYAEELDSELAEFAEQRPDDGWLAIAEAFAEYRWPDAERVTINTYNDEDSLSQTLQYVTVTDRETDEQYVVLQIHGGCDIRGGYTAPRVFTIVGDEYCMYENNNFTASCSGLRPPQIETLPGFPDADTVYHHWTASYGDLADEDGCTTVWDDAFGEWDEESGSLVCPKCAAAGQRNPLTPYAQYPYAQ